MNLVDLMYRYINKLITGVELLEKLENIEIDKYPKDEQTKIRELIKEVSRILNTIPNEIDEAEKNRIVTADKYLKMFENLLASKSLDEKSKEKFAKKRYNLLADKNKTRDGGKLFRELFTLMTNDELVCKYADAMTDEELFDFITKYISLPLPPKIDQKAFDALTEVGIAKDDREGLWRLAFNYNFKGMDFLKIVKYFVDKRDAYYLTELISAVQEDLDMDILLDEVIATKDRDFFKKIVDDYNGLSYLNDEQKKRAFRAIEHE